MLLTRFLASRSVCSRGERGKLDMAIMSLSVKSIASWSYSAPAQPLCLSILRVPGEKKGEQGRSGSKAYLCSAQVLNSGYFMACSPRL